MKLRLGVLVLVPTVAMIAFALIIGAERSEDLEAAQEAHQAAELIESVGALDAWIAPRVEEIIDATADPTSGSGPVPANSQAYAQLRSVLEDDPSYWSPELRGAVDAIGRLGVDPVAEGPVTRSRATTVVSAARRRLLDATTADIAQSGVAARDSRITACLSLLRVRAASLREVAAVADAIQGGWTPTRRSVFDESLALEGYHLDVASMIIGQQAPVPNDYLILLRGRADTELAVSEIRLDAWNRLSTEWAAEVDQSIVSTAHDVVVDAQKAQAAASRSATVTLIASLAAVVFAMAVVLAVATWLVRRVSRLTSFATEFSSNGAPSPLADERPDELGELARALDSMALRIDSSAKLAQTETSVLEMIADGKPLDDTLDVIATLFVTPGDSSERLALVGPFSTPGSFLGDPGEAADATRVVNTNSGTSEPLPATPRGRLAHSLITLALRRAFEDSRLEEQATIDELTGLLNRRAIIESVDRSLELPSDDGTMGILYVDLDEFKEVNDRYGHAIGDQVIKTQARRLARVVEPRGGDVGRLGGDEFLVVLPSVRDAADLMSVGEKIVEALSARIETDEVWLAGTASVGGAMWRYGVRADQLLGEADVALYEAKREGKRLALMSTPRLRRRTSETERLKAAVRSALEHDEFVVYYQPVWHAHDEVMSLRGFEALVRWNRPGDGIVGPGSFLWVVEDLRLMASLDQLVFRRVCNQVAEWSRNPMNDTVISVNVSPAWIDHPDFVEQVSTILTETGCDPARLVMELTEETVMQNVDVSRRRLDQLGALGLKIAIDDFGQGHSSLAYLRDLPIDELKADRRFIAGVDQQPRLLAIVSTIRDLAAALDLRFVAEGVENEDEASCIIGLGCDIIQGFWSGYPMPAHEAAKMVEELTAGMTFARWKRERPHLSNRAVLSGSGGVGGEAARDGLNGTRLGGAEKNGAPMTVVASPERRRSARVARLRAQAARVMAEHEVADNVDRSQLDELLPATNILP